MLDKNYIEEIRVLDKKESKTKLAEYALQFDIKLNKTKTFENMLADLEEDLAKLADIPMPEVNEGLSISDLIDADDELNGASDYVVGLDEAKPEAVMLFDAPSEVPVVIEVKVPEVELRVESPIGEVISPQPVLSENTLEEAVSKIIESEAKEDIFELPAKFAPSLIKLGPGAGYCTLPWWIYEWITKNPDWKEKPNQFPHHYGLSTIYSLIYYIKREGQVRIRETRNSRFFVLN